MDKEWKGPVDFPVNSADAPSFLPASVKHLDSRSLQYLVAAMMVGESGVE